MSAFAAVRGAGQAAILSAPAAAPLASSSLAEARSRARSFFREVAREIPWIMRNYQLEEITTASKLRSQLADIFRARKTENSKVIDIMLFKGQAEVHEVLAHYMQRHHLISNYVSVVRGDTAMHTAVATRSSPFLSKFLKSNNTD